jgi:hypothetical protein
MSMWATSLKSVDPGITRGAASHLTRLIPGLRLGTLDLDGDTGCLSGPFRRGGRNLEAGLSAVKQITRQFIGP